MKPYIIYIILCASLWSCRTSQSNHDSHLNRLSNNLEIKNTNEEKSFIPITNSLNLEEQLLEHKLPGFSLVIFEDYQIVYVNQWGMKSSASKEKINRNTAFSTASISKPITALLCFILEEKGFIDLDAPVSNYLKRWALPSNEYTENEKPTWKNFLNHTAGTTQHGFADFYEGDDIPTIKQSLLGQLPRYDGEIEFLFTPGSSWSYSGGGYVIIQMALEDHFSKPIAELAEEHIFEPLALRNTSMYQPNEKKFLKDVALVHDEEKKVIRTGLPITPQVAPSGLWSTPTDLAVLTIEIQKALRNESTIISHSVAKNMTDVTALKDAVGGWSYGWQRSFGFHNYDWLMHNGSNTGVGGDIFATMTDGNGFIFLANGEKSNRFPVIDNVRRKILSLMNWNKVIPEDQRQEIPSNLKKCLVGTHNDFLYGLGFETKIVGKSEKLYVQSPFFEEFLGRGDSELIYLKNGLFKVIDYPNYLEFLCKDDKLQSVVITKDSLSIVMDLLQKDEQKSIPQN